VSPMSTDLIRHSAKCKPVTQCEDSIISCAVKYWSSCAVKYWSRTFGSFINFSRKIFCYWLKDVTTTSY